MAASFPLTHTSPARAGLPGPDAYAPGLSRATLAGVLAVHAALLGWFWLVPDTPEPTTPPRPLTVSLITPAPEQPQAEPEPTPVPPQPQAKPLPPPPLLVVERPRPTPQAVIEAPKPAPAPEPVPEVLPPPPAPPAAVAEAPKPTPAPPPPTPPRAADYLNNPKPPYPALSRRLGEEGIVRLNVLVNADGSVAQLEIAKSSGYPRLDEVALKTVQSSWKFEPARLPGNSGQPGKPIQAWVIVPIQFTLRS